MAEVAKVWLVSLVCRTATRFLCISPFADGQGRARAGHKSVTRERNLENSILETKPKEFFTLFSDRERIRLKARAAGARAFKRA